MQLIQTLKEKAENYAGIEFESKAEFVLYLIKGMFAAAMLFGYIIFGTIVLEGIAMWLP